MTPMARGDQGSDQYFIYPTPRKCLTLTHHGNYRDLRQSARGWENQVVGEMSE